MTLPGLPDTIPDRLPGTQPLDDVADRRDAQLGQVQRWWDRRVRLARRRAATRAWDPADLRRRLLEATGAGRPLLPTSTVVLGPDDAATSLIVALDVDGPVDGLDWRAVAGAARSMRVIVPAFVRRERRGAWCRRLAKDRRHILHRLAFPLGRTLVGAEADVLVALVRAERAAGRRVRLIGEGDGALTALVASAALARDGATSAMEVAVGGLDGLTTPLGGGPIDRLLSGSAELPDPAGWPVAGIAATMVQGSSPLRDPRGPSPGSEPDASLIAPFRAASDATDRAWRRTLRSEIARTKAERDERWGLRTARDPDRTARRMRRELQAAVGRLPADRRDGRPIRSRLLRVTEAFVAYEVVVPVARGLDVWGHLLIPRAADPARLPAVICQHGLDGSPASVTGVGDVPPADAAAYHAFGARLAERGYVVLAPYLTVPAPQSELVNPLVVRATALGVQRSALELRKLRTATAWLRALPMVDPARVGYYGLSYGGHAALWLAPLVPGIAAAVASGHANDWTAKTTDPHDSRSFLAHPDEDFTVFDGLRSFTHPELVAAAWPRPTCIEAARDDPILRREWLADVVAELETLRTAWDAGDRLVVDVFDGVHEVTGTTSFAFLDRWLRPGRPSIRDYEYTLPSGRDLPGIGDTSGDTDPFRRQTLGAGERLETTFQVGSKTPFHGVAIRASGDGRGSSLRLDYGSAAGGDDLGSATIGAATLHPLWDLWHAAPVPRRDVEGGTVIQVRFSVQGPDDGFVELYGPRPLGASDARVRPAIRPIDADGRIVGIDDGGPAPTHAFAAGMLAGAADELGWDGPGGAVVSVEGDPEVLHDAVVRTAARWIREDLAPCDGDAITVSLALDPELSAGAGPGSHRVTVDGRSIRLDGATPRGLLRAAAHLGDRVATARRLVDGSWERREVVRDRITTGVLPAGTRYHEAVLPSAYTDGLLDRIARSGFTGIWTWLNLEDATVASRALPELETPESAAALERLQSLADRAAPFALDTWVYLAAGYRRAIPEAFWAAHPELRGGDGWLAAPLCTSDPRVLAYHREVIDGILERAPGIRGFAAIFDIEGFYFCGSEEAARAACPRCRHRTPEDLALEVLTNLDEAIRAHGEDRRLIAWSYGWDPSWVERLVPRLPTSIALQADFTKFVPVTRGGRTEPAGDYTLSEIGPSPVFQRLRRAAREPHRPFFAKTEHAMSLDSIFVPYLPVLDQLRDRASAIRAAGPDGWFANWEHVGFLVPLPAQVLDAFAWDPVPDGEVLLDALAARRFGPAVVAPIRRAWSAFSDGIRAFPYSDPVARSPGPLQKGPSQPLWLDPGIPAAGSWRSWQNDVRWTAPWGPDLARAQLRTTADRYADGVAAFEAARPMTCGRDRARLEADIRLGRVLVAAVDSTIMQIDWITARDALAGTTAAERPAILDRLVALARDERARTVAILPVLEADSRLGFAQDGGGVIRGGLFTPALVRRKLGLLDDVLVRELPAMGATTTEVPWADQDQGAANRNNERAVPPRIETCAAGSWTPKDRPTSSASAT